MCLLKLRFWFCREKDAATLFSLLIDVSHSGAALAL
jgi:hypothetical protein